MKTIILNSDGVVVNVGVGEPSTSAPDGFTYITVDNDFLVGPGWTLNEDGTFTAPPRVTE